MPSHAAPRVLLVEDNALIALDLEDTLLDAGFEVVGPVQSLEKAMDRAGESFDAAVLDIGLNDQHVFPVADILCERGVPFMFLSGYDRDVVPSKHAARPFLQKPCSFRTIAAMLRTAVEA